MAFYDHVIHLDRSGRWWFEALGEDAVGRRFEAVRATLQRAEQALSGAGSEAAGANSEPFGAGSGWRLGPMRPHGAGGAGHTAAVAECLREIAAGDLFQANLCLRLEGEFSGSAAEAFIAAAQALKPAYGAFIATAAGAVLSFSPELFLRRRGDLVTTAPIKGTAPRAPDAALAEAARLGLMSSAKDAAENVMIVDLMRNDLGRVAVYGSVEADPQPSVKAHPGIWHLVTEVRARLREHVSDGQLLRATFPPGSVTGAPKVQAMKVINALEGSAREVYTGAIGYIGTAAGLELNVAIRTLEIDGTHAWLGCGGGVVADSTPEAELREAYAKAAPIIAALGSTLVGDPGFGGTSPPIWQRTLRRRAEPSRGVFETVLVVDGVAIDLERHLVRLQESAAAVFGTALPADVRGLAAAATASAAPGPARAASPPAGAASAASPPAGAQRARMRIVLGPDGELDVGVTPARALDASGFVSLTPVTVPGGLGPHKLVDRDPLRQFEQDGCAALICDADGQVLEGSWANVWLLCGDELLTPPADGRILAGVVRARVLESAPAALGVGVREAAVSLEMLRRADAILTTSSIRLAAHAALSGEPPAEAALEWAQRLNAALSVFGYK